MALHIDEFFYNVEFKKKFTWQQQHDVIKG